MDYIIVGLNHKTAPVALRERAAIANDLLPEALHQLITLDAVDEGLILSTCNRVEVYAASSNAEEVVPTITDYLCRFKGIEPSDINPYLYHYCSLDAVKHLFRVTSSLDSLVVGEPQIVGQVKEAYRFAQTYRTSGLFLNRFLERALFVSKKVRSATKISAKAVSVGSAGVELAKKIFEDLSTKKVVLIGAGEIGELVIARLEEEGVFDICLLNRNVARATDLLQEGAGVALPLEKLGEVLLDADLVISSSGAPEAFISHEQISQVMEKRRHRPMFFIDLGVPRNVEEKVNTLSNVYLYNIDDLHRVVTSNVGERQEEALRAEEMIEKEASQFYESIIHEEPVIALLGKKFESIRQRELTRTLGRLAGLSVEEKKAVEKCTESIVGKILHDPVITLKSGRHRHHTTAHDLLKKLFRLDDE